MRPSRWEPRSPTTPRVEGSGRTVLACPTPAASARQPTRLPSRPIAGSLDPWPTSLTPLLAPGGLTACHGVHRPPDPRAGQTARPGFQEGMHHDRGQCELRRQPHRRPRAAAHRGWDRPGGVPGWRCRAGGTRRRRSSPSSCGATRPSTPASPLEGPPGRGRGPAASAELTAEDGSARSVGRSWPRSWGQACDGRRPRRSGPPGAPTSNDPGPRRGADLAWSPSGGPTGCLAGAGAELDQPHQK
jgi:hypothetical protein